MVRMRSSAIIVMAAMLLTGCTVAEVGNSSIETPRLEQSRSETPHALTDTPVGEWGETGGEAPWLTFYADGTVQGNDGCNGLGGTWTITDGIVELELMSTAVGCLGPDVEIIGPIDSAIVEGDSIRILDSRGNVSGTLDRRTTG
jgi:heat shock protein HslJ